MPKKFFVVINSEVNWHRLQLNNIDFMLSYIHQEINILN